MSGPSSSEYKPSEAEKASTRVAYREHKYFKEKYDPLLQDMRDKSKTLPVTEQLRSRANADTMQTLTSNPNIGQARDTGSAANMTSGMLGQLGQATRKGENIKGRMQTGVLATARGQAAEAQSGMSLASKLETSENLTRAKAKQDARMAAMKAAGQMAGAYIGMKGGPKPTTTTTTMPQSQIAQAPALLQQQSQGNFMNNLNLTPTGSMSTTPNTLGQNVNNALFGPSPFSQPVVNLNKNV
jgi:hypothetical protein